MDHHQQQTLVSLKLLLRFLRLPVSRKQTTITSICAFVFLLLLNKRLRRIRQQRYLIDEPSLFSRHAPAQNTPLEFDEYDIVIAGGGTAGCVLASRLSEDASLKVLLLEAGGSGMALPESRIPSAWSLLYHGPHVYDLYTEPQEFQGGKRDFWPRGRMLGGSSSINAMMAQYGVASDFDEWAQIIKDDSWSYQHFSKYIRKFERFSPHPHHPAVDSGDRGNCGPVEVGYRAHLGRTNRAFVDTCPNVGIPISSDFNTEAGKKGANQVLSYVDSKGRRVSTEAAYLTPEVLARPNLTVATHAHVTKILFDTSGREPRATGVEFSQKKSGPCYRVRAIKEVIVCGGAIHSPQILMLSGIGPASHLAEHHIPVVHDLPGVGSHLIDHPGVDLRFKDKSESSSMYLRRRWPRDIPRIVKAIVQYQLFGTGPLASNIGEAACFFRTDDPVLFPSQKPLVPDSNSGHDSPDIEIVSTSVAVTDHEMPTVLGVHTYSMHVVLLRPTSKGTIRLKSNDPWQDPAIDPKYCQTQRDVDALVRGTKAALEIAYTAPLTDLLDHSDKTPLLDSHLNLQHASDDELAELVRERAETLYHPASTCRMAPLGDDGVVDSQLRVYGVHGLRVCDASIFPWLISGHPTGPIIASAEKLADVIKHHYAQMGTAAEVRKRR